MQKYYILLLVAFLFNLSASKASLYRDSIGVENFKGKKVIIHQVVAKDTYYSIGRRYHIAPKVIMSYNDDKYLQIGVIIKVPTSIPFNETSSSDTPPVATAADAEGKGYTEHIVAPKENLNRLAERYSTTVEEIKRLNNLNTVNLRIGQVLKIPVKPGTAAQQQPEEPVAQAPVTQTVQVPPTATVKNPPLNPKPEQVKPDSAGKKAKEEFIEHKVASNETIYSIATKYHLTIDELKAKNKLTDNSLYVGQNLLIKGQYPVKPAYPSIAAAADTMSLKDPSLKYPPSSYGLNKVDEKGTAMWIMDMDLDSSKMLVLHRTAPIGTVMKITNPMSNRSTFAKVVGKFTENESTRDVVVVMTKAVADALGALDKRFFCNLTYSSGAAPQQEDEQQ